jgi:hypothetical protein
LSFFQFWKVGTKAIRWDAFVKQNEERVKKVDILEDDIPKNYLISNVQII